MNIRQSRYLSFFLLVACMQAKSEGQCPDGYYQSPEPEKGVINCLPRSTAVDGEQSNDGPHWEGRWGAISFDFGRSNVGLGVSVAATSKRRAKNEALANCRAKGGTDCRINLIYDNQCAVVIAASGYSRSHGGPTVEITAKRGIQICEEAGFSDCQVYYKACSLPEQVQ